MTTMDRTENGGWLCSKCREVFRTSTMLRGHQCAAAAARYRCNQLRWSTAPVTEYLTRLFGVWETGNPNGYSGKMVERLTGVAASSWHVAVKRGLMDHHADQIATALAVDPEVFWDGWRNALEVTDEDRAFIEAWCSGRVSA